MQSDSCLNLRVLRLSARNPRPRPPGRENTMLARNHSPADDSRSAHLRRYSLGATPISRLNTRLKELSDPYPTADATSENDRLFERIMAPALYIRHCVRYSRGEPFKT